MEYQFSVSSFFMGLIIMIVSAVFIRFHQWAADNFAYGVSSYDKFKMYGLIGVVVGFIVMINVHSVILTAIANLFFGD